MTTNKKFSFGTDFQQEILQFTVTDPKAGFKALELFESEYFILIPHIVIAETLKKYYGKKFIIPSQAVLKEEIRQLLRRKQWQELVHAEDKEKVFKVVKKIYSKPVRDPDTIYKECRTFARYMAFKDALENVDLDNFESWESSVDNIVKSVHKGTDLTQRKSTLLFRDAKQRAMIRIDQPGGNPTPWWQLNSLTNSGGTTKGNIVVVLSEAKFFKTGFMVNTALGYAKMGKVILYVDLENGEQAIATRADQGIMNKSRKDLIDGTPIKAFLKMIRKYKRFGGEIAIIRLPAGSTTVAIQKEIQRLAYEEGLIVEDIVCDYPDIMGSTDGQTTEDKRISQVYIDLKNLAEAENIQSIWCPSHVNREGSKEGIGKGYKQVHMAKASDKVRHADMVWSMVQDEEEIEAKIIRLELTAQRDGLQTGRIWFWANLEKQKLKEFNRTQVKEMDEMYKEKLAKQGKNKSRDDEPKSFPQKKNTSDI